MPFTDKIAETHIANAIARGELDNLPGQGKPLVLDDNSMLPEEMRAGYRILKNAGVIPPELVQRLEINKLELSLQSLDCEVEKQQQYLKLSLLKCALARRS